MMVLRLLGDWDLSWKKRIQTRKIGLETRQNRAQKFVFWGRQVGAFSDFWQGHTAGPFIFWQKTRFLRKMCRLRGWCNITPVSAAFGLAVASMSTPVLLYLVGLT